MNLYISIIFRSVYLQWKYNVYFHCNLCNDYSPEFVRLFSWIPQSSIHLRLWDSIWRPQIWGCPSFPSYTGSHTLSRSDGHTQCDERCYWVIGHVEGPYLIKWLVQRKAVSHNWPNPPQLPVTSCDKIIPLLSHQLCW